ncbi:protein-lysine N-methyltransferase SMYD4-like isoform X2 [Arctopsyche grandis]|uniref:protein-lysine N-methyltransferase SMYD4-like isoform X2 n=1 Tax=Arctopsyche grandis TaxID=121162 RepID=UPI00406D8CE8
MTSSTNFTEDYHKWLSSLAEHPKDTTDINSEPQDEYTIVNEVFNDKQVTCELISWLNQFFECSSKLKSATITNEWTSSAKFLYKKKKYEEAISCYNICLDYAPRDDLCFANGLNSRARVFCDCKKFQEAKNDIELLLSVGHYPIEKSYKIYSKLARCHFMTGNIIEGEEALKKALEHLINTSGLSLEEIDIIKLKLSSMSRKSTYVSKKHELLPLLEKVNTNLNGSSDALLLARTELKGRHIVSKVDLKKDELLFVEAPFAFVPLPSESTSAKVCSSCGTLTEYIIVCDKCCDSHYCSEDCRIVGWDCFHQWECEGSKISLWSNIGIVHLAFRVVLEAFKTKYSLDALNGESKHNAKSLLNHLNSHEHNSKYGKVFHLLTNQDKISKIDLRKYAITSIMVFLYLKRHVLQMICNASAISSEKPSDRVVAVGIYPSSSMMNHSCVPNTKNTFNRNVFIVRAEKDIKAGSEIYNCYGPQVGQESAEERQEILRKQYVFDCNCEACIDGI